MAKKSKQLESPLIGQAVESTPEAIVPPQESFDLARAIEEAKLARIKASEVQAIAQAEKAPRLRAVEKVYQVVVPPHAWIGSITKKGACLYLGDQYQYLHNASPMPMDGMRDKKGRQALAWMLLPETRVVALKLEKVAKVVEGEELETLKAQSRAALPDTSKLCDLI
jgi:hypothetical protein